MKDNICYLNYMVIKSIDISFSKYSFYYQIYWGFPGGSDGKESAWNAEDLGLIPGLGRSPAEWNDYPLQYFCLENAMDKGAWQATVHRIANSQKGLSEWARIIALLVAQSCPTLCDPMDCSPSGSSVHGILQARILVWVAMPFSRGSSWCRDGTQVSCIAGKFFTIWTTSTKELHKILIIIFIWKKQFYFSLPHLFLRGLIYICRMGGKY